MQTRIKASFIFTICFVLILLMNITALAKDPVVRAVFFFSHTCPHCQKVITQDLPPLTEKYGDQLQILGVNVALPEGQTLYQNTVAYFQLPEERTGIPTLVVADTVLFGSAEIPEKFPGIIEAGLSRGGIDWPNIPGLDNALSQIGGFERELTMAEKFQQDLTGNTLSVVVLLGMVASVIIVGLSFTNPTSEEKWPWAIPILSVLGMIVASYLAFVEVTGNEAVCGPVGDCNTVQQSEFAVLFGVIPVGLLGLVGYIAIFVGWLMQNYGPDGARKLSALSVWGMAAFGVLFSIYLTFLEPFVIGATCVWCLSSAIIITLQLMIATPAAKNALFSGNPPEDENPVTVQ